MNENTPTQPKNEIIQLNIGKKSIYLLGTAHISSESVLEVRSSILEIKPDVVMVELDERRYQSIRNPEQWTQLNLKEIIKNGQLSSLIASLIMTGYQRKMGNETGVRPGSELLEAVKVAESENISYELVDRDIRITIKRLWKTTKWYQKISLLGSLVGSIFDKSTINEDELSRIRQNDVISEMINEMDSKLPNLKKVLIDERDQYMCSYAIESNAENILMVVGAGHVLGMKTILENQILSDRNQLNEIPKTSLIAKYWPFLIPALIISGFIFLGSNNLDLAKQSLWVWFLANGIPSALGAILAFAHPFVAVMAFLSAPITSLNPMIGVGMVTAFVQIWMRPPTVNDFEKAADQISDWKNWWKNRFLQILLVFILTSFGSAIGTWIGAFDLIKKIFL
jgi:pheromone shutdown-related protein TraB